MLAGAADAADVAIQPGCARRASLLRSLAAIHEAATGGLDGSLIGGTGRTAVVFYAAVGAGEVAAASAGSDGGAVAPRHAEPCRSPVLAMRTAGRAPGAKGADRPSGVAKGPKVAVLASVAGTHPMQSNSVRNGCVGRHGASGPVSSAIQPRTNGKQARA